MWSVRDAAAGQPWLDAWIDAIDAIDAIGVIRAIDPREMRPAARPAVGA